MSNEGYAKIASVMSHHPELAVFRRFNKLNYQTLLYLQAELTQLEADLKQLVVRDQAHGNRDLYSTHWWYLAHSEEAHDDGEQWDKVLQIRETLKEYNEHLQQAVFVASLQAPKSYDIGFLRSWMRRPKMGNHPLLGPDHTCWSTDYNDDLLAVSRRESTDPLSRWLINSFIPWFHQTFGKRFMVGFYPPLALVLTKIPSKKPVSHDPSSEIVHYKEGKLHSFINLLATVLASLIPIMSILILYFVTEMLDRLAIIVAFTALFAFCLATTTKASRVEVFASTSAFAAVQVVFYYW